MPIPVDAGSPPYQQAAGILRTEITAGRFKPGQRLPAYRELQERFGIANMTARSAIAVLRSEGLVRTVQGRGTFVLDSANPGWLGPALGRGPDVRDRELDMGPQTNTRTKALPLQAGAGNGPDDGAELLKFERIAEDLRGEIRCGSLKPGRLLPSQAELMKTYRASSLTTQKAIRLLKDEGLVAPRQGRGTFVAAPGQTREPGALNQPTKPATDLADTVQKLNDIVLGMDRLIKDLARRVSVLEAQHRTDDAKPAGSTSEENDTGSG